MKLLLREFREDMADAEKLTGSIKISKEPEYSAKISQIEKYIVAEIDTKLKDLELKLLKIQ
jgi:hypothetical protein